MEEQDIRAWLDKSNQQMLTEIEVFVPVNFVLWEKKNYACHIHKDNGKPCSAEILCKEPLSQAKIAHELLHAKTSLILGDNGIMFCVEEQTVPFQYMLKGNGASDIGNVCEHVIFFPDYLDMGYDEGEAFEEPERLSEQLEKLSFLANNGLKENGRYSSQRVCDYLSLVFSLLFYPNENRFKREIKQLRKIDIPLFSRIMKMKDACMDMAIVPENKEVLQEAYYVFANDMNQWFAKAFEGAVFTTE